MSINTSLLACGALLSVCSAKHGVLLDIVIILSILVGILLTFFMILLLLLLFRLLGYDKEPVRAKEGTGTAPSLLERPEQSGSLDTSKAMKGEEVTMVPPAMKSGPSSSSKPLLEVLRDEIKESHTSSVFFGIFLMVILILLFGFRLRRGREEPILSEESASIVESAIEQANLHGSLFSLNLPTTAISAEDFDQGQDDELHPEVLVLVKEGSFTKETVRRLKPVSPKVGAVILEYNPVLDEARPETMDEYLNNFRIFFVIDDSGSMVQHWNETRNALSEIADYALTYHSNAVDIRFFNSQYRKLGVQGVNQLMDIFASVSPSGWTPTGRALREVLDEQLNRLDNAQRNGSYSLERPLEIIVLTDGVPNSDTPPALVIEDAARRLKSTGHHQNWVSIQFVQIGDNPKAEPTLLSLIDCPNNNHMVNTISYSQYKEEGGGKLTPQVLERIVLGGLHPNMRSYYNQYRRKLNEGAS